MQEAYDLDAILKERGRGRPAGQPIPLKVHLQRHADDGTYTAGLELNYEWSETQLYELVDMWKAGIPVQWMAQSFGRDPDELLIIVIDLARYNVIHPRAGGLWGRG